jgi:hypothetical protein
MDVKRRLISRLSRGGLLAALLLWAGLVSAVEGIGTQVATAGTIFYADDFRNGLAQWQVEAQDPATTVSAENGKLDVYSPEGVTIWFRHKLAGNYEIRFDATPLKESFKGYPDRFSDLNVFWNASLPGAQEADPTKVELNGALAAYNRLQLYYVGFGANGNQTTRLRRYDGTAQRPQLAGYATPAEATAEDRLGDLPPFARLTADKPVAIRIVSRQADSQGHGLLQFFADGHLVFEYRDGNPYVDGWFAFRTTKSHFRLQNFSVIQG